MQNGSASGEILGERPEEGPARRLEKECSQDHQKALRDEALGGTGGDSGSARVGIQHWEERRREWTTPAGRLGSQGARSEEPPFDLGDASDATLLYIYRAIVKENKPFKRGVNLLFVLRALKVGWIREGTWPTDYVPAPGSD